MARLFAKYNDEIVSSMINDFQYSNRMAVPRLSKVIVHMGVGRAIEDAKRFTEAVRDLTTITGQKPKVCRSKAPIAGFKLREGQAIGCMVTLRGQRMFEFLDRLISVAIPRIRDFRGLSPKSFDRNGNYNFGLTEQIVFPEVNAASVNYNQGMDITVVVTNSSDKESLKLLTYLGMPFKRPN